MPNCLYEAALHVLHWDMGSLSSSQGQLQQHSFAIHHIQPLCQDGLEQKSTLPTVVFLIGKKNMVCGRKDSEHISAASWFG